MTAVPTQVARWLTTLLLACWSPPVDGPVVVPFRAPECEYCSGHRGVEFAATPGTPVRAVAAGRVTFSGRVAGATYVVIEHADGIRATYGMVATALVQEGASVQAGSTVAVASPRLYFGLRRGTRYLDPGPWFGAARTRPRLVPLDGRNRRPGRAVRVCGS